MANDAHREAQRIIAAYEAYCHGNPVEKITLSSNGQRMILKKSVMILDQVNLDDPSWPEEEEERTRTGQQPTSSIDTSSRLSHLIKKQLEEKQAQYNFFLHFLASSGLLDQLTDEQKCYLASGAEKLAALKALRDWENSSLSSWKASAERQLFNELVTGSMRHCVLSRQSSPPSSSSLRPHQLFYSQVSQAEDILGSVSEQYQYLCQRLFEVQGSSNESQIYSLFLLTQTNLLFHAMLKASAEYHYKCHQNVYQPYKSSKTQSSSSSSSSSSTGDNGIGTGTGGEGGEGGEVGRSRYR